MATLSVVIKMGVVSYPITLDQIFLLDEGTDVGTVNDIDDDLPPAWAGIFAVTILGAISQTVQTGFTGPAGFKIP